MERSRLTALYMVLFRFVPLFIILTMAFLWQAAGPKVAVVTGAALFAADAALLIALVVRSGKQRGNGPPED
ncbi:MAG TPA: hypothetical protein VL500_00385 [Candidatus Eisenbacteria bacterium]|jgi:hypothetical protein|nr:hypothetical protein [Candidatus Eisenbacteria bacterium]